MKTAVEPPALVCWECVGGHEPWAQNTFRFELGDKGDGTIVRFWQDYARELSDDGFRELSQRARACELEVDLPQTGLVLGRRPGAAALPRVQPDVVVIAPRREEGGGGQVRLLGKAEDVPVEGDSARNV